MFSAVSRVFARAYSLPLLVMPRLTVAPQRLGLVCMASPPAQAIGRRGLAYHQGTFRTPSSVKKRFRVTPAGAIVRCKGGKSHLNFHKSSAHVNRLSAKVALAGGIRARYLRALQLSPLSR